MFYNRPFLSGSGKQGLMTARPILVSLLYPCCWIPMEQKQDFPSIVPFLVFTVKVGVWPLPHFFPPPLLHHKQQNKAVCNRI